MFKASKKVSIKAREKKKKKNLYKEIQNRSLYFELHLPSSTLTQIAVIY